MLSTILTPTDFSAGSQRATDYAADLAAHFGATLWVVHVGHEVGDPPQSAGARRELWHLVREDQAQAAKEAMARLTAAVEAVHPSLELCSRFATGAPHAAIIRLAEELSVDLIVMGTSGLTGFSHFLIGSTAERVVRVSPIPVMTVRGEG